jgi:hypothetical protein
MFHAEEAYRRAQGDKEQHEIVPEKPAPKP